MGQIIEILEMYWRTTCKWNKPRISRGWRSWLQNSSNFGFFFITIARFPGSKNKLVVKIFEGSSSNHRFRQLKKKSHLNNREYILSVLPHTTTWDQLWGDDETLKYGLKILICRKFLLCNYVCGTKYTYLSFASLSTWLEDVILKLIIHSSA